MGQNTLIDISVSVPELTKGNFSSVVPGLAKNKKKIIQNKFKMTRLHTFCQ